MPVPRLSFIERLIGKTLRLFFWNLYHTFSWSYDTVANIVSVGRWQRWVATAADYVQGPCVLELGFGPGHLQVTLKQKGLSVYGVDESISMARQAWRRMARSGISPNLARALAQELPFAAHQFDSIAATFPTPYIIDPRTLAELGRLLKPDGQIVIVMAAWITGNGIRDRIMRLVFQITGQAPPIEEPPDDFLEPYLQAGFAAQAVFVDLAESRLLLVVARQ